MKHLLTFSISNKIQGMVHLHGTLPHGSICKLFLSAGRDRHRDVEVSISVQGQNRFLRVMYMENKCIGFLVLILN